MRLPSGDGSLDLPWFEDHDWGARVMVALANVSVLPLPSTGIGDGVMIERRLRGPHRCRRPRPAAVRRSPVAALGDGYYLRLLIWEGWSLAGFNGSRRW
ncbi:hypothetical protein ACLOJK_022337 [Asimina triloba]